MNSKYFYTSISLWLLLWIFSASACFANKAFQDGLMLYYWNENPAVNFGDYISVKLVERIVGKPVKTSPKKPPKDIRKLLAVGSILYFARENDVIWGSGVNGKKIYKKDYNFNFLDVRAVRGPFTRAFLYENFGIDSPEIYGDPALLFPYLFPEFKRSSNPTYSYVVIPHYSEEKLFPRNQFPNVIYPTDPWDVVIARILDSQFVISSSLHGIIIAEAYGIPARLLRISENEPLLKYQDYYLGTNRSEFNFATSIEEALKMGGEPSYHCDLKKLYESFPIEFWPGLTLKEIDFEDGNRI